MRHEECFNGCEREDGVEFQYPGRTVATARLKHVQVRFGEEELGLVRDGAKAARLSVAAFVRNAALLEATERGSLVGGIVRVGTPGELAAAELIEQRAARAESR